MENQSKSNAFRAPGTGAPTRRTLRNAYLSMVSEGARSPAENAAAEKGDPPGRMGAYAFSSMADHANPLEGVTFSRSELSQAPTHNHHADPSFAKP